MVHLQVPPRNLCPTGSGPGYPPLGAIPRMAFLSSRKLLPSFFRSLTASLRPISYHAGRGRFHCYHPSENAYSPDSLCLCQPFKDLKQTFAVSRRAEQLRLHSQQRVVTTVEDSALRAEMGALESQEEDSPKRILWYKPLGFLGVIRPHRRHEVWSASLWQSFFATCVGATGSDGAATLGLWLQEVYV
jgi:hypothetical protein